MGKQKADSPPFDLFPDSERISKDIKKNLEFRQWVQENAGNEAVRQAALARCARDIVFWIDGFVWVHAPQAADPKQPRFVPCILYPVQEKAVRLMLDAVNAPRDILVEKSREMLGTYMCLFVAHWHWLFKDNTVFTLGSRNEDLVDKTDDPDSMFDKLRQVHKYLPEWMKPGPGKFTDNHMLLKNLSNGSVIKGVTTTATMAVGGRATAIVLDEFPLMEAQDLVWQRTGDVTGCRIVNGTPNKRNMYSRLATGGKVAKVRLHWADHPEKRRGLYRSKDGLLEKLDATNPWPADYPFVLDDKLRSIAYDAREARCDNPRVEMAEQWDINYLASGGGFFTLDLGKIINRTAQEPMQRYEVHPVVESGVDANGNETFKLARYTLVKARNGPLSTWMPLENGRAPKGHSYGMGGDISQGVGASNSVLSFIDVDTGEKVAEYVDPYTPPDKLANVAVALADVFGGDLYMVWEGNGCGDQFAKRVMALGHRHFYRTRTETAVHPRKHLSDNAGWRSSRSAKRVLLNGYEGALERGAFVNHSEYALNEMYGYVHLPDGSIGPERGKADDPAGAKDAHGDRVIADALANMTRGEQVHVVAKPKDERGWTMATVLAANERRMNRPKSNWTWRPRGEREASSVIFVHGSEEAKLVG